jgi:hypothetical protein
LGTAKQAAGWLGGEVSTTDPYRRHMERQSLVTLLTNRKSQGSLSDLEGGALNLRIGLSSADFEYNMRTSLGGKILMRHIDIDSLSEDELIELNHKIVARLRFLSQMRSHSAMLDFRVGERVKFHPDGGPELLGTLTCYNKKTVTVVTDAGQHWNVSPSLLTRANPPCAAANSNGAGIARFPDRSAEK